MDKVFGEVSFVSSRVEDNNEGYVGMELFQVRHSQKMLAASIVFWDATGQFAVRLNVDEVPLEVLEELIEEAKSLVS